MHAKYNKNTKNKSGLKPENKTKNYKTKTAEISLNDDGDDDVRLKRKKDMKQKNKNLKQPNQNSKPVRQGFLINFEWRCCRSF
ncbi:MAG: hypothetical protein US49_C0010G0019 [candidate division TM6 bacterium GW2011_GWF2_37_49]|nr:MAG: hypothetical protein US49_C0010G0019 [candidate division TM6 bacterium GW2011_GWF2_37_49]